MKPFQQTIVGVIVLGVISSLIGAYIWEKATKAFEVRSALGVEKMHGPQETLPPTPGTTQTKTPDIDTLSRRCTFINNRDYSARVVVAPTGWNHLNRGEEGEGYLFSLDGALYYNGDMLTHNIPVTAISSRDEAEWVYAQSIKISPKTPQDPYALLQACDQPNLKGLCWALFVVHLDTHRIEHTSAGHYGVSGELIAWIKADDIYALVVSDEGGKVMHYRIHLATGQSTPCDSNGYY